MRALSVAILLHHGATHVRVAGERKRHDLLLPALLCHAYLPLHPRILDSLHTPTVFEKPFAGSDRSAAL